MNGAEGRDSGRLRALVIHPDVRGRNPSPRCPSARLEEAAGLARAIDLDVVHSAVHRITRPRPATLLGRGVIDELAAVIEAEEIGLCVVDAALTPIQQRNLEQALDCKVIDRTGLILEIFGERARTKEGSLQVELAALTYHRSRLVRSWTHLERQRGGFGFLGGPGESQLEIDRRLTSERIARIKIDLEQVKRTRGLHRSARQRVPYPVIALVGYTNAGKSTLFNRLTRSAVAAEDMLFATLDPTMRRLKLPSGQEVILSDTVGFISELPTTLVAAFRATLEEVSEADLVLHVRDIAHPDSAAQRADVLKVLEEMGLGANPEEGMIEVLNKIDLLDADGRSRLARLGAREADSAAVSAATGEGLDALLELVARKLGEAREVIELSIPHGDGATLAWLYRNGEVRSRRDDDQGIHLTVALSTADRLRFDRRHGAEIYSGA